MRGQSTNEERRRSLLTWSERDNAAGAQRTEAAHSERLFMIFCRDIDVIWAVKQWRELLGDKQISFAVVENKDGTC